MADKKDSSKAKQIKLLLAVLGTALGTGLVIALSMLYYYNPTGSYLAKNVLLDPESAYNLHFVETASKGMSQGRYSFEGIYFFYFDQTSKQNKTTPINKESYEAFYQLIAKDKSIVDPSDEMQSLFNQSHPSTLSLKVRSSGDNGSKGMELTFSEIHFVNNGDYYRIQLRQSGSSPDWAYFYHDKIYQKSFNLFNSKQ